jgi:hypothetical protein
MMKGIAPGITREARWSRAATGGRPYMKEKNHEIDS